MLVDVVLLLVVVACNTVVNRRIPAKLRVLTPSVGWLFTSISLARGPFVWYACLLLIQGIFATVLVMAVGLKSDLASRAMVFPFMAAAASMWAKDLAPPFRAWTAVMVTLVQLWSFVGGLVLLGCYPGSILQVIEPQETRTRRLRAVARALMGKKDKSVATKIVPSVDGRLLLQTLVVKQAYATVRWVVYCGGNAEFLENTSNDIHVIADALRANVILYNPRGIGFSTGFLSDLSDLADDATAAVRAYVESEKIDERQLLFFGHSVGGGAAAQAVADSFPRASLVIDRSFSAMSDAAVAYSYFTPNATRTLFPWLAGDLRTYDAWKRVQHNRKLILYTKQDEIIKFDVASIARLPSFQNDGEDSDKAVELAGTPSHYHNSLLTAFENYHEVCARMNKMFPPEREIREGSDAKEMEEEK